MTPLFFKTQNDLRKWFEANHLSIKEQWIGYYKKAAGNESITWSESVDEALCFGWIDGLRKSIDSESYMIRFTPRKPESSWSAVNIEKVEKMKKLGLMKAEGLQAYSKRKDSNSMIYSYEKEHAKLSKSYIDKLKANKKAWEYFNNQLSPSYKKQSVNWVMSAKREETQIKRLNILIESSAKGEKVPPIQKYLKR